MNRRIRWQLICEDREHERFFYQLLVSRFGTRPDVRIAPRGEGNASVWVLRQYAIQVREYIRRRPRENIALIVVVDGDQEGLRGRMDSAAAALSERGEEPRKIGEPIAICVPTWSIETWFLWLIDGDVDEESSLKDAFSRLPRQDLGDLAARFMSKQAPPPSAAAAKAELDRIMSY